MLSVCMPAVLSISPLKWSVLPCRRRYSDIGAAPASAAQKSIVARICVNSSPLAAEHVAITTSGVVAGVVCREYLLTDATCQPRCHGTAAVRRNRGVQNHSPRRYVHCKFHAKVMHLSSASTKCCRALTPRPFGSVESAHVLRVDAVDRHLP